MPNRPLTLRLDPATTKKLDALADATQRSRSFLISEAVKEYVDINQWQVAETRKALKEADEGDFADDAAVQQAIKKLTNRAR